MTLFLSGYHLAPPASRRVSSRVSQDAAAFAALPPRELYEVFGAEPDGATAGDKAVAPSFAAASAAMAAAATDRDDENDPLLESRL